jgi:bifunctional DNase/RNase
VELPSNQPIVLLREVDGDRYLPIWIGAVEATAIAYEQQGVKPARPLTHDLLRDILAALQAPLRAVEITELKDNVFYADLLIGEDLRVSARPSDSIALACGSARRSGVPSRCSPRPVSSFRTSRRTRSRSSASSSTRSVPRISPVRTSYSEGGVSSHYLTVSPAAEIYAREVQVKRHRAAGR